MPHLVCGRAIKNVTNETVAVGGHCNQVNILFAGKFNNLVGRFAKSEDGVAGKAIIDQRVLSFFEVGAVLFHLLTFSQFQLIKISRYPPVGNMREEEMLEVADLVAEALQNRDDNAALERVRGKVRDLTRRFPLPG